MKTISLMMLAVMVSACGISENLEKTNVQINAMNGRIKKMSDNLDSMNGSISSMSGSLASTSRGIHSQSLLIGLNEMLKPENTKYITLSGANIVPMIPAAKGVAEIITSKELAGLAFIYISEINTSQVEDVLTQKQKNEFDTAKFIKLNGLGLISALAPQSTIDTLVEEQIISGGEYKEATLAILVLRSMMVKTYLVDQALSGSSVTLGQYDAIKSSINNLCKIQNYPFFNELSLKLYGFYDKSLNTTYTVEKLDIDQLYKKLEQLLKEKK